MEREPRNGRIQTQKRMTRVSRNSSGTQTPLNQTTKNRDNSHTPVKQVIVIRRDLKMRRGKEIAQGSHGSVAWLAKRVMQLSVVDAEDPCYESDRPECLKNILRYFSEAENEWIAGSFSKICVRVDSEEELMEIYKSA